MQFLMISKTHIKNKLLFSNYFFGFGYFFLLTRKLIPSLNFVAHSINLIKNYLYFYKKLIILKNHSIIFLFFIIFT